MELFILVATLLLEYIEVIMEYSEVIIPIVLIYFVWVKIINPAIKKRRKNKKLTFNEYDDYDKIQQQQMENEQLENELETTEKVFLDEKEQVLEGAQISSILEEDSTFDVELFKKWSKNIFTYLQLGKEKELKEIKTSISDTFYEKRIKVLKDFERDNIELKREELLIEEIKILDYSKWMDKAQIKVYIKAKLKEYIINKETQKIIKGNARKLSERGFILTFQKKDADKQVGFVNNCQSCGASISDTEFGTCQYCGSLVNPIRYNWTLIKYEVL